MNSLTQDVLQVIHPIVTTDCRQQQIVVMGLATSVLGVVIASFSVPLTIYCLEPEWFGVWTVILVFMACLVLTDFGLGNGLTDQVDQAGFSLPEVAR